MKTKHLLQIPVLLALLFSPVGAGQPALASTNPNTVAQLQSMPAVSVAVAPMSIAVNEFAAVTVNLNNVPAGGYTSAEFTCTYNVNLVQVSDIVVTGLFGPDPAVAISDQQDGSFIAGMAGSQGNKATTGGIALTFRARGLQAGQTGLDCKVRVSQGDNTLNVLESGTASLTVLESTSTPTDVPVPCDKAEFIADVTIPNGTVLESGSSFIKTWRLRNAGSCTWTTSYQLVFFGGDPMGAPRTANLNMNVAPGHMVDVSVYFGTPIANGQYTSLWKLRNALGVEFGIGDSATDPFAVNIIVAGPTSTVEPWNSTPTPIYSTPLPVVGVAYDFVTQACTATWSNDVSQLPCPGLDGDTRGFVRIVDNPNLETGTTYPRLGLMTFPYPTQGGEIRGRYPPIRVQSGDRFRSIISCEADANECFVSFRLDYQIGSGPVRTFAGPFIQKHDYQYYSIDADLSALAGQDVSFILVVSSVWPSRDNRALWVGPILYRTSTVNTPLPSETPSPVFTPPPTSPVVDWFTYSSSKYRFQFKYPPQAVIAPGGNEEYMRFDLPFGPATNLREKYLEVLATDDDIFCHSPMGDISYPEKSEMVFLNGFYLLKEVGSYGTAGHNIKWETYSASRHNVCVHLNFILHAVDPAVFETPPPLYNEAAESAIFEQIVSTSVWLFLPPTTTPTPTITLTPSPTHTSPPTEITTPSAIPEGSGHITGQTYGNRPALINIFDANDNLVVPLVAYNGVFNFTIAAGTYTLIASADGFLSARTSVTITEGTIVTMPILDLPAGDVDNNNVIDQFDAMTVGMNYNNQYPEAADLNRDGIINVLDLEVLARNYRKTGPVSWEN